MPVFFNDGDRRLYLSLLAEHCASANVSCLAWCLMDNHVHLILVPRDADGLRATLGETHRRYSRFVNQREGWTGYLFQGRFGSYAMDDAHLMAALRYVENNPVAAGLVAAAQDWPWSSAASHIAGKRQRGDPLTDLAALAGHVPNWRSMLQHGAEAGDAGEQASDLLETIEARLRTGRPLGTEQWLARQETALGRSLKPGQRGPKARSG